MSALNDPFHAFFGLLTRSLLLLAGALFVASLVTAGTFVVAVVLLWRLVSGRRPVVPRPADLFAMFGSALPRGAERWRATRPAAADIVEAEVREVPSAGRRLS